MKTTAGGFVGDGAAATAASLVLPENIAFDKAGNYYIADAGGNRIRKVDTTGKITTIAGTGVSGYSGDGGAANSATLYYPDGVAVDSTGNIFIADNGNAVIREVSTAGTISTYAAHPSFLDLASLTMDSAGNLYAVDQAGCAVHKITPTGAITVVAGIESMCGYNGDNISATSAELNTPYGVAMDSKGNLLIADAGNNRIRKVNPTGIISTVAGSGTCGFSGDNGSATKAELCLPHSVVLDSLGNYYIADLGNYRVRKVARGIISTIAGTGLPGFNGDGLPALSANLDDVVALGVNKNNIVYFVDDATTRVRRIH